jgi:hypothetical protein
MSTDARAPTTSRRSVVSIDAVQQWTLGLAVVAAFVVVLDLLVGDRADGDSP